MARVLREFGNSFNSSNNPSVISKIKDVFPGSLTNTELCTKVQAALFDYGYGKSSLLATSLCCDEVSRELEHQFESLYGVDFSMGGLAGFPFGGATSFGAMAHHIPNGGSCLIVYGPHVGVDSHGTVGRVDRRGRPGKSDACCGSAMEAVEFVKKVMANKADAPGAQNDPFDAEQNWVRSALLNHGERLLGAEDLVVELPFALFDCQDELMKRIIESKCAEVDEGGLIGLLGGVEINTPPETSDYFLPKVFELKNNKGKTVKDLLSTLI